MAKYRLILSLVDASDAHVVEALHASRDENDRKQSENDIKNFENYTNVSQNWRTYFLFKRIDQNRIILSKN